MARIDELLKEFEPPETAPGARRQQPRPSDRIERLLADFTPTSIDRLTGKPVDPYAGFEMRPTPVPLTSGIPRGEAARADKRRPPAPELPFEYVPAKIPKRIDLRPRTRVEELLEIQNLAPRIGPDENGTWGYVQDVRAGHFRPPDPDEIGIARTALEKYDESLEPWQRENFLKMRRRWEERPGRGLAKQAAYAGVKAVPWGLLERVSPGIREWAQEQEEAEISTSTWREFNREVMSLPTELYGIGKIFGAISKLAPTAGKALAQVPGFKRAALAAKGAVGKLPVARLVEKHPAVARVLGRAVREASVGAAAGGVVGAAQVVGTELPAIEQLKAVGETAGWFALFGVGRSLLTSAVAARQARTYKNLLREFEAVKQGKGDVTRFAATMQAAMSAERRAGRPFARDAFKNMRRFRRQLRTDSAFRASAQARLDQWGGRVSGGLPATAGPGAQPPPGPPAARALQPLPPGGTGGPAAEPILEPPVAGPPGAPGVQRAISRAQWNTLKEQSQGALLVFRSGESYRMYFDDAAAAASLLDVPLQDEAGTPTVTLPAEQGEARLQALVGAGQAVAVVEEKPGAPAAPFERVVEPGQPEPEPSGPEAQPPAAPSEPPPMVRQAAINLRRDGPSALSWMWDRGLDARDKQVIEKWIVASGHPLATQAGTAEGRFRALVREVADREFPEEPKKAEPVPPAPQEQEPVPTPEEVGLLGAQKPALVKVLMDKSVSGRHGHPYVADPAEVQQFLEQADEAVSNQATSTQLDRLEKAGLWDNQKLALTTQGKNVLVAALRVDAYRYGRYISEWEGERPKPGTFKKHLRAWEKQLGRNEPFGRYHWLSLAAKEGWFSDGRMAYKLTAEEKKAAVQMARRFKSEGNYPSIEHVVPAPGAGSPAEVIAYRRGGDDDYDKYLLEAANGKRAFLAAEFHDEVMARSPSAVVRLSEPDEPVGYVKGSETVGVVMPISIEGVEGRSAAAEAVVYPPHGTTEEGLPAGVEEESLAPSLAPWPTVPAGAAPKDMKAVVIDTFREWPAAIPKVGQDYWTEVMAAAKRLGTAYRYRALRRTVLGSFSPTKGVKVQDVRDALTATHELGHNIDWRLNKVEGRFPRSIKLRFPQATVGERALREELKAVSRIIRPDLWDPPSRYVTRHTELMADFASHYILDPERCAELAPNVTPEFERKLADDPELFETVSVLQEARYAGPEEPPVAPHIRETFPLPKEYNPLQLAVDLESESYVKVAESLGIQTARNYKRLMFKARRQAERVDALVPDKTRQGDLVVLAEKAPKNPWTGRTIEEIKAEGLAPRERKALTLYRAYQEEARQTVNKYLRGSGDAEYIRWLEDYFIHTYKTPMTERYKSAITRWAKRSPQARKRILPDLAAAMELELVPRVTTLADGLRFWAGVNYRVATNRALLRTLPRITNADGVSVIQNPKTAPAGWPTVDYWPIRQTYKRTLGKGRGVLLWQGRVAVDPEVKPFIDALFDTPWTTPVVRVVEGLNATWKAFQLTLFSLFHHQAEFFSACGALGPRALPFVGGFYGREAQRFGAKPRGMLPTRIGVLKAGKQLEQVPEFMDDYLAHGGQVGHIGTEGIGKMQRMLRGVEEFLQSVASRPGAVRKPVWAAYVPTTAARRAYDWTQRLLWDNVQRAKLVSYYYIVADGAKNSNLPIDEVKETAAKYIADNFGGQEWLNTVFRKPKTRQAWTQLMMSVDWTWSQIKTLRWPFRYGGRTATEKARLRLMRKIGRKHWFWYLTAVASFTVAGNYAMNGKGPWENEPGRKLDIDWTNLWRILPWNSGRIGRSWRDRGDYSRRYIGLGKAGRELVRWVTAPHKAFGYKLSPVARTMFEQATGYNMGSQFPETWARDSDLNFYETLPARTKHLMENFKPFAFSGNNAFLAFPSRKGMTRWKAARAYQDIYEARAAVAAGGLKGAYTRATRLLVKDDAALMSEIGAACKVNDVDAERARKAGRGKARGKSYTHCWSAARRRDRKALEKHVRALIALGVTPRGVAASARGRGLRSAVEREREMVREVLGAFREEQKRREGKRR